MLISTGTGQVLKMGKNDIMKIYFITNIFCRKYRSLISVFKTHHHTYTLSLFLMF